MQRILIVEDSPTQGERLRICLEDGGYEAEVASSAEQALDYLEKMSFSLIISDIVMPGLSGYEFCQRVRSSANWSSIPVILLTTRKDPMDIIKGLECGADNFFTKPYDADRLLDRIKHILDNRRMRQEGKLRVGIEIAFFGKIISVNSDKSQILDLLVSTFEDVVQTNRDLERSKAELAEANSMIEKYAKEQEKRALSSEERYRSIVQQMPDGLLTTNTKGFIESMNPAAQAAFGYTEEELSGKHINTLMAGEEAGSSWGVELPGSDSVLLSKKGGFSREVEGRRKDGSVFPMSLMVSQMNNNGDVTYIMLIRNLTQEKRMEQQLRQSQKMEAVGQLTGGIAHDFNNLLTVIIGNAELLEEQLEEDPHLSGLARMIGTAAARGADSTHGLLAFARRQVLAPKPVMTNQLVEDMDGLLKRSLGEHIEIVFSPEPDLWQACIDPSQLENALLNLCLNARDSMPKGGLLTIETSNKVLDEEYAAASPDVTPGDYVMLAISDTGVGIPPEHLDRVFEPFFTTKEKGKGTGLGLPMVYGFVKQSAGHIAIYSELGQGTSFKIYLPRWQGAVPAPLPEAVPVSVGGKETVLLVEDDELVRKYADRLLQSLGYKVLVANNGSKALELMQQRPDVDLLFTDMIMPGGMNGRELYCAAREIRPHLKVLYTSGYAEWAMIHQGRVEEEPPLLGKPYRRADLAAKIREVLGVAVEHGNLPS